MSKRTKRDPLKRTKLFFWGFLFLVILGVAYFVFQPSTSRHNQCDSLPSSFTVTEGDRQVEIPIGTANLEVSVDTLVLRPFTRDSWGRVTYLTPEVATGTAFLNPLETVQDLRNTYDYSIAYFSTTQFYRGSITTETGHIPDALFFIVRSDVNYTNCWTSD